MANALLNVVWINSNEKVVLEKHCKKEKGVNVRLTYGSLPLPSNVQLIVNGPPLVAPVILLMVRAEAKGATSTRRLRKVVSFYK